MIPHFRATSRRGLSGFEKMRLRGAGPRRFVRRRRKRAERGREGRKCVVGGVSAADEAGGRLRSQFFLVPSTRRLPRERSDRGARGSRRDRESRTESRRHRCRRRRCFSDRSSPASLTGAKTIWSRDHVLRLPRPYLLSPLHSPFPVSKCFFFYDQNTKPLSRCFDQDRFSTRWRWGTRGSPLPWCPVFVPPALFSRRKRNTRVSHPSQSHCLWWSQLARAALSRATDAEIATERATKTKTSA